MWFIFIVIGLFNSVLIYTGIISINLYHLGSIWLVIIGLSLIITCVINEKE